jgi:hypothetical protein
MVRANDQGSHFAFSATRGLWRRGVCLELDYRRTIGGGGTQEAQEAGRLMSNISVAEEAAPTDGSSLFKIELRCDMMDHRLAPQAWVASHRKRES